MYFWKLGIKRKDTLVGNKHVSHPRIRRKSKKGPKNGPSVNKYAGLVPYRRRNYFPADKTSRELPVLGKPGEIITAGLRLTFHGRIYELCEDTTIPPVSVIPMVHAGLGRFKLVAFIKK